MPLLAVFLYCPSDFVESNWIPWSRPQQKEHYPLLLPGQAPPETKWCYISQPTRESRVTPPHCLTSGPSPEPKDTVTSPEKSMASTTASAASLMDTSSSSPTVGNHGPVVSQASLSRPLGALSAPTPQGRYRSCPAVGKAAAECPPERMMGSTSLYSRRTQMKSRARSWRSKGQVKYP